MREREKKESSFFYFQIVAQLELSLFFLKLTFMIKKVFFGFRQLHFLSIKKLDVASIINFEQSHFFTANFNVKHFLLKWLGCLIRKTLQSNNHFYFILSQNVIRNPYFWINNQFLTFILIQLGQTRTEKRKCFSRLAGAYRRGSVELLCKSLLRVLLTENSTTKVGILTFWSISLTLSRALWVQLAANLLSSCAVR